MAPRPEEFDPKAIEQKEDEINEILKSKNNQVDLIQDEKIDLPIVWRNVLAFIYLHSSALVGIYLLPSAKYQTNIFALGLYIIGGMGITAGAHRLWCHRSYKATFSLRLLLAFLNTVSLQNSILEWSRDHRVHHKHSETNADPHNAKRGFFFAHMGWLMMKKHPDVKLKGQKIPVDDLLADPIVYWQHKLYVPLAIICCFVLPSVVPMYLWGESGMHAYYIAAILRYVVTLHATWCVNSVAHFIGHRPYDRRIRPVENRFVALIAGGEGFHNYHHAFPQDYSTSEFGALDMNFSKLFIDGAAMLGLAYDRNKINPDIVLSRRKRTGDLSDLASDHDHEHNY